MNERAQSAEIQYVSDKEYQHPTAYAPSLSARFSTRTPHRLLPICFIEQMLYQALLFENEQKKSKTTRDLLKSKKFFGHILIFGKTVQMAEDCCQRYCQYVMTKREAAIHARLREEFGLINCWREANPGRPPAQTLRWSGNRTISYHCDGIFVPVQWRARLRSCAVLSGAEWDSLSDHNPVIATFSD